MSISDYGQREKHHHTVMSGTVKKRPDSTPGRFFREQGTENGGGIAGNAKQSSERKALRVCADNNYPRLPQSYDKWLLVAGYP